MYVHTTRTPALYTYVGVYETSVLNRSQPSSVGTQIAETNRFVYCLLTHQIVPQLNFDPHLVLMMYSSPVCGGQADHTVPVIIHQSALIHQTDQILLCVHGVSYLISN